MRNSFSLNQNKKIKNDRAAGLDVVQGAGEARSETYPKYGERALEPATQQRAKIGGRLTGFARRQAAGASGPVDVLFSFNGRDQYARPVRLTWDDEEYWLGGVQFWYAEHRGAVLIHHYRVGDESGEYTFELSLETENLTWNLDKATKTASTGSFAGRNFIGATS